MTTALRKDPLADYITQAICEIGEDPNREGLLKTPPRAAKALREITSGYKTDLDALFNGAFFKSDSDDMITVCNINFYSLCEHHMLPFLGKAHVGYIPNGRIVGLSKIPRLVRAFSLRMQVQERLTRQIAETLYARLNPKGVAVLVKARHLCMEMRGAHSEHSPAATMAMLGAFKKDAGLREEFFRAVERNS